MMSIRKRQLVWTSVFLTFLAGTLIFAGRASAETLGFSVSAPMESDQRTDLSVTVLDESSLAPIEGASVVVGDDAGGIDGTARTDGLTGADGRVRTPVSNRSTTKSLTVAKAGYSKISVVGIRSWEITIYLKRLRGSEKDIVASGRLGGWKPTPWGSNLVQAGLVLRTMSAMSLLDFKVESLISPLKDTIDVYGPRDIPSNVVLPKQDLFLPVGIIRLNKPDFRLPVPRNEPIRMVGVHGQMKVMDILPVFRDKGKFDLALLNKLEFTRVGLSPSLRRDRDFRSDFNATTDLREAHQVRVTPPDFAADVISVAVTDLRGDRDELVPTDVKMAMKHDEPGRVRPVRLRSASGLGTSQHVLTMAIAERGRKLSGIVSTNAGRSVAPGRFMEVQEIQAGSALPESVVISAPEQGVGSVVFKGPSGTSSRSGEERNEALWTVHVLPSAGPVRVPSLAVGSGTDVRLLSVAQFDFGASFDEQSIDGSSVMTRLERFTHHWRRIGE